MADFLAIVHILTKKCWKLIVRRTGNRYLFFCSVLLVYGGLYLMWWLTKSQIVTMFTSEPYAKLAFDFQCTAVDNKDQLPSKSSPLHCEPYHGGLSNQAMTPGDLLLNWLNTGQPTSADSKENLKALELISSILMNGLPLVGLDDFVHISDFTNRYVGKGLQERLMSSVTLRDQFDNFLNVRQKKLIIAPDNACSREFQSFLFNHSHVARELTVEISPNMDSAMLNDCCDDVWAIIEIQPVQKWTDSDSISECNLNPNVFQNTSFSFSWDNLGFVNAEELLQFSFDDKASVVIRMHPAAIPDTRNYEWSPLKGSAPRQQSGELLYFTSGFLTLQMELQNFIRFKQYHSTPFATNTLQDLDSSLFESKAPLMELVQMLTSESSDQALKSAFMNSNYVNSNFTKSSIYFPLYHRAFPTHEYQESHFWKLFGTIMTIALTVLFSLPAAVVIGNFQREILEGHIDMLSTLPNITALHSLLAWCVASWYWLMALSFCTVLFFHGIFQYCNPLLPSLALCLLGISLGPVAALFSKVISKPDTLVLSIPIFSFIMLLPGIIYYDLAFDIQRSTWKEMVLCLFPPSAMAMILRLCFSNEAIGVGVSWLHRAPVSNTTVSWYLLMLVIDSILYMCLASLLFRKKLFQQDQSWPILCCSKSSKENAENEQSCWILFRQFQEDMSRWFGNQSYEYISNSKNSSPFKMRASLDSNDSVPRRKPFLQVHNVSKSYQSSGVAVPVLSDIDTQLDSDTITVLLGSNGAGKTTFMKIIAGLDPKYRGSIKTPFQGNDSDRVIGWCPQNDAIFDLLTVQEHMELYTDLLCIKQQNYFFSYGDKSQFISRQLEKLGMLEHASKTVMGLSGGMKRRLTLALSFLGDPKILLLDEPTSGCDSWTRELVRKDVLSRKKHRTILISTHHSDDIEVLADRVWFLNERSLEIDEEVDVLVNKTAAISEFEDLSSKTAQSGDRPLKFICKCEEVDHLFRQYFGETNSKLWQHVGVESHSPAAGLPLERQYILPIHKVERLQGLLQLLDQQQLLHWSLETCTVFEALCNLYADAPSITGSSNFADVNNSRTASPQSSTTMQDLERGGYGSTFMRQVRSILWMRSLEIRKNSFAFFSTNVLIPFLVVLALCYGCRDAQYPKVEITSNNLDGIGEICMASGRQLSSQNQPLSVAFQHSSPSSIFHKIATPENKDNDALEDTLNSTQSIAGLITNMIPTSSVDWRGKENSNKLWSELLKEYFQHDSQRWGAIVLDDVDNNWIESTIILDESDMKLAPRKAFEELQSMHDELCGNSSTSPWSHVKNEESVKHLLASELTFCDSNPALSIKLNRNSSSDQDDQGWYLAVKSHQEMRSNFTLLSNVTSDHAAPVFLKEVLTPVHDAIWGSAMLHNANGTDRNQKVIETPIYRLFSFPLPESNIINRRFIERGYLGSMMIVMYLMITSVSSVRFVAKLRACKVKRQLHLSGLSIPTYWIANAMADTILIIVSLFSIFLAIAIGGEPVKSFFWNFPPFSGCLFLFALFIFAHAIVAANFALVVLSEDQLASQLFVLITTLSGGVFFKMYLDRQHGVLYESISNIFIMFSPTFAFSTIMFDMFSIYTHSITAAIRSNSLQNGVDERFLRIVHCLVMMLLQTLVYLSICIAVDEYIVRVLHGIQQLRWYFAAQNMSHFSSHQKSTTVNVEETSSLLQEEDRIEQSLTKAAGDRMIRLLSLHPHFRVGIFPIINSNNYQEAYSSQLPQSEMSCNMRLASNDIEMEPIHPQHNHHNHSRYLYESSGNNRHVKALQAIDVCVGYPDQDRLSLCNLNVSIAAGEKIAVMGMNGGGKTTFFETCALASKIPMHGKLLINGHEVVSDQDKIINSKCLGYVPQEDGLLDFCTVQQCLELFSNMQGRSLQDEFDFHGENIDGFLPTKFLHYPTHALSGGTKKKLLVRLSNIGKPNVLLMDECTTGVDPIAAEKIIEYLKANITDQSKAMKEQSLIFSSHRIDESFAICDKVLMLVDGQVYIDGPSSIFIDLMTSYYQVDILLTPTSTNEDLFHIVEQYFGSLQLLERVVVYNDRLLRLTLHKQRVPVSRWWSALLTWQHNQVVACFYFRTMEMEEILATILSTTSNNSMTL